MAAKLTDDDVREMRRLRRIGLLLDQIKVRYGVSRSTVQRAVDREHKSWRHVKEEERWATIVNVSSADEGRTE